MKLSVVILNYNVRHFLQQCLMSVMKAVQGIDAEVIVVDNLSPDDSCTMVKALFPNVILIENDENAGFPKGNNKGVAAASGKYVCILNPDTVVAENTFSELLDFIETLDRPGIVGAKLIDGTGRFLPESKRGVPTPWTAFTKMAGLYKLSSRLFGKYYAEKLPPDKSGPVDVLVGAFMLLKRQDYLEAGGFDERFFMYGEDIDLSYSMLKAGKANYYFAGTSVIHYKGESSGKDARYFRNFSTAMQLFYEKHFPSTKFFSQSLGIAAKAFTAFKISKAGKSQVGNPPEHHILISSQPNLKEQLSRIIEKNVTVSNLNNVKSLISQSFSGRIYFDMEDLEYRTVIAFMEENAQKGLYFRLLHPGAGFGIGSDSSDSRGEVLHLVPAAENNP